MQSRTLLGRRESRHGGFFRRLARWLAVALVVVLAYGVFVKFEWWAPVVSLRTPITHVGENARLRFDVTDAGSGLTAVNAAIEAAGTRYEIVSEEYPASDWQGSGVHEKSFELAFDARRAKIPEGDAKLVIRARDGSWLNYVVTRRPSLAQPVEIDVTPPGVQVLTTQHYMRLGGSDLVVYKPSKDAVRSGVEVESYFFPGASGLFPDPGVTAAMFAVPQDLTARATPKLVVEDRAGNRREVKFFVSIRPQRFRERTLEIDDDFLQNKVPDLLRVNGLPAADGNLVAGYLEINRELRKSSEAKLRELCSRSEPAPLFRDVFVRQPNSAPLSNFADRRTYTYKGGVIDSQVHLGYDLASLRQSPVAAANDGNVVYADNLGIYGNTVVIDHGLGIFSLYGHLSSVSVPPGQAVHRGDTIGQTGETGLAGGDHLHFSILVSGVHVDPVEWWDPKWIRDHIFEKIEAFQKTGGTTAAESTRSRSVPGGG